MLKFDLARNALRYLIKTYGIKELYIPYYLCDVMRQATKQEECKPLFYHIDDSFVPNISFPKESFILYPNYFGVCSKNVENLANKYPNLIIDNAHSYYSKPCGFASFNAGHKFGYKSSNLFIEKEAYDVELDYKRRELFEKYDVKLGTSNLLNFDLQDDDIPFCYPYLAQTDEEADNLANKLVKAGKIIYRYWIPLPKEYLEYQFYRRLVPIPL